MMPIFHFLWRTSIDRHTLKKERKHKNEIKTKFTGLFFLCETLRQWSLIWYIGAASLCTWISYVFGSHQLWVAPPMSYRFSAYAFQITHRYNEILCYFRSHSASNTYSENALKNMDLMYFSWATRDLWLVTSLVYKVKMWCDAMPWRAFENEISFLNFNVHNIHKRIQADMKNAYQTYICVHLECASCVLWMHGNKQECRMIDEPQEISFANWALFVLFLILVRFCVCCRAVYSRRQGMLTAAVVSFVDWNANLLVYVCMRCLLFCGIYMGNLGSVKIAIGI